MNRNKVIKSMIYKFSERLAVKGLGLIIGIVLARLLMPEDFGQVAIITTFIALATAIIEGGLSTALVQQKDVTDDDYSTVFYISLFVALLMVITLFLTAPLIALFYELPNLIWPIRVYSFSLLFGAFNSVQVAKIQREMNFRAMMWASLVATIISGALGIAFAYMNWGIWALVFYGCSSTVLSCFTMLYSAKWFPKLTFSFIRAKILFSYGWKMLVSSILCSLYADIRSLIIGKKYSTNDLGYYNRGQQYPHVISATLDMSIQSVMFPTLARSQDNKESIKSMLSRTISLGSFILIPTMIGLACVSRPLIILLLTEKWLPATIYMQLLCIAEAAIIFKSSSLIAIKAIGRSDVYMKLEAVRRIVMIAVLLGAILIFDSVLAIAISYVISAWIDVIIISIPLKKLLNYGFFEIMKDNWKSIFASLLMGAIVLTTGKINAHYVIVAGIQIFVGVISYIALAFILKIDIFKYILDTAKKFLVKERTYSDKEKTLILNHKKNELSNCNFVKTILMILVVAYHCILYWSGGWFIGNPETSIILSYLAKWLNSFHIYAFTLVSGYIFYYLKHEANKYNRFLPFVANKAKRLLIPYVFVSIVWVIPIQLVFYNSNLKQIINQYVLGTSPSQLWFLLMLFAVFVIFYPLSNFLAKHDIYGSAVVLLLYGIGLILPRFIPNVFQISTALAYIPLFYIGFKIRQHNSFILRKIPLIVWIAIDILVFALTQYLSSKDGILFTLMHLGSNFILHIVGALMAFIVLQKIADKTNWKKSKIFGYLSKNSMIIYLFHQQVVYISLYSLNNLINPYIHATINFVVSMAVSLLFSFVLMEFKATRILIGEK